MAYHESSWVSDSPLKALSRFNYTVNNNGTVSISNAHIMVGRTDNSTTAGDNWSWALRFIDARDLDSATNGIRKPSSGTYWCAGRTTASSLTSNCLNCYSTSSYTGSGSEPWTGTGGGYIPQFDIPAANLKWTNGVGTIRTSGYVKGPPGTTLASKSVVILDNAFTVNANPLSVGITPSNWSVTLNYSSSRQYLFTINAASGGSGSYTYAIASSHCELDTSTRKVYAKSDAAGYTDTVFIHVVDNVTGESWEKGSVAVNVTMNPRTYTVSYNSNGTNVTNMPSNQTKTHGKTLTLSSTKPKRTGYTFSKWNTASNGSGTNYNAGASYTANAAVTLYAQWTANSQTNNIEHWAWGFQNGEGNNGTKNAFKFKNTTFSAYTDASITLNNSRAASIPNGYDLMTSISTNSVDNTGAWTSHNLPFTTTQKPNSMLFQYGYIPFTYNITYNLDGGTNNSANPSTYTVLYGVTFSNPTKTGYIFSHWTDANGTTITGINPGANASFSSGDDLYSKLSTRTIGDQTITAHWTMITYNIGYNLNGGNLADQSINSNKVIVNPRGALTYNPANGDTIQQNYFQLTFPTKIGYKFIGWTITGMDTSPHRFWYKDNDASNSSWHDSNSTSFNNLNINNKHLYVFHPTATDGATITITANWQFRGNYIYKNDTDKWVKVVPFVYDGSTWRETQPFVYTSNGWKSLIN